MKEKIFKYIGSRAKLASDEKSYRGYTKIIDTQQYSVYVPSYKCEEVMAAYESMLVTKSKFKQNTIMIYPYFNCSFVKYKVELSPKNFPGLLKESKILSCLLIPYMRRTGENVYVKSIRLVIITDKGQLFHNYPARSKLYDGPSQDGDVVKFEESVVWDIPGRKFPSKSKECSEEEMYYPGLPDECYEHHPILNSDKDYYDQYGNGGFGSKTKVELKNGEHVQVSRFYFHSRALESNPFFYMCRGNYNEKMCLIGTYRSNVDCGVRTCIFASSDGGRTWYCKYEFTDEGEYSFRQGNVEKWGTNFGNPIKIPVLENTIVNGIKINKRTLSVPSGIKEQKERFAWQEIGEIKLVTGRECLEIKTEKPHGLQTGNIIALTGTSDIEELSWMLNNEISSDSGGNGKLFKVEMLDDVTFKVYEFVSNPHENLSCRHIHHINRIKDGWIIGTGEIYPNGWLLYAQFKEADTFSIRTAEKYMHFIRLNSTALSAQRTMGAILHDDRCHTFIYASDHDLLSRNTFCVNDESPERLMHNSTGVFKGLLSDIDDRTKFDVLYEAKEPCFFFQKLDEMLVFGGQRGELALSFNDGLSWTSEHLSKPIIRYRGSNYQYYHFDTCIIKRK